MLEFSDEVIANHIGVIPGFAFVSEYFSSENGTPLIRIRNLLKHKTETFYRASFDIDYMVSNGDILIGMDGDFNVVRWRGEPGLLNQRICKVSSKSELLNEGYLFHCLQPKIDEIHRKTPQTTVRHLSTKDIEHISIPFFPLNEQRRIAEILDTIDEAIQKTEALISKLKAMKQGLLHDLLTRGLDKNGKLRDPKAHPEQFKDSPLGRIPKEWEVVSISEIASHVGSGLTPRGGSEVYKTSGVMFIRSQNVTFEGLKFEDIAFIDWKTHELMQRSEVFAHDVLLNITGASIGRCCPLPEELGPTNVNQHVCAIRLPNPCRENALYLSSVLGSHIGQHQIDVLNAGGNREGLNYQQLRSFVIPWPEKDERSKAADIIGAQETRIRTEEQYRNKLKLQKKGLMHNLLTGKVRVEV